MILNQIHSNFDILNKKITKSALTIQVSYQKFPCLPVAYERNCLASYSTRHLKIFFHYTINQFIFFRNSDWTINLITRVRGDGGSQGAPSPFTFFLKKCVFSWSMVDGVYRLANLEPPKSSKNSPVILNQVS